MDRLKILFRGILVLLILSLPFIALTEENNKKTNPAKSSENTKKPKIHFLEDSFDFGKIDQQQTVEHIFKFKNTGNADLKIDHLQSSCSCTGALISSKVVPPGGSGEIKVSFSSKSFQGEIKRSVQVFSNDPDKGTYILNIKSNVRAFIEANPNNVDFGSLKNGETVSRKIAVKNLTNEPLTIKEVKTDLKDIKIGEFEKEINPNEETTINLTLTSSSSPGNFFGNIEITTSQHSDRKLIVAATGKVLGDITLTPDNIYFGIVKKGGKSEQKIKIANNSSTAIKLLDVKSNLEFIRLNFNEKTLLPKENIELILSLLPAAPSGSFNGRIEIKTDSKVQPLVSATLYGVVKD